MKSVLPFLCSLFLLAACGPQESDTEMMDDSGMMEETMENVETMADSVEAAAGEMADDMQEAGDEMMESMDHD